MATFAFAVWASQYRALLNGTIWLEKATNVLLIHLLVQHAHKELAVL